MNPTYTLKNFRVFNEQGASFEIAPITILTGCNSSGKSSITKSMMLLNDIFSRIIKDYTAGNRCYLEDYTLRLNKGIHNLGKFASIVNDKSVNEKFTIEFSQKTYFFSGKLTASISFVRDDGDIIENGKIQEIVILNSNAEPLCVMNFDTGVADLNFALLKDDFFEFAHYASIYKQFDAVSRKIEEAKIQQKCISNKEMRDYTNLAEKLGDKYHYIFKGIIPSIYKRDDLDKLIEQCNFEELSQYKSVFYIEALRWLDGYKKVDVKRIVQNHIKRSIISILNYQEEADAVMKKINLILDEFYNSSFNTFKDFYLHYENLFLQNVRAEFMSKKKENIDSFLSRIEHSLAYKYAGINSELNFLKDCYITNVDDIDYFWSQENLRFVFITHYMRLVEPRDVYEKTINKDVVNEWFDTPIFDTFILYFCNIIEDILVDAPSFINNVNFVDANRANVRRLYAFDEQKSSFNKLLQEYLSQKHQKSSQELFEVLNPMIKVTQSIKVKDILPDGSPIFDKPIEQGIAKYSLKQDIDDSDKYVIGSFAKKWLQEFEIADELLFETSAEGAGVSVYLVKDGVKRNLADFGFGVTQLVSMLLQIEINIFDNQIEIGRERIEEKANPVDFIKIAQQEVEQGSALGLKLKPYLEQNEDIPMELKAELVNGLKDLDLPKPYLKVKYGFKDSCLVLEEPESHLHPCYQSKLADMLLMAYQKYNIRFIVETHSEYLVRRSQVIVAENKYANEQELSENCPFKVYYMPSPNKEMNPYDMEYQTTGGFKQGFGEGFYDEAANLDMTILMNEKYIQRRR